MLLSPRESRLQKPNGADVDDPGELPSPPSSRGRAVKQHHEHLLSASTHFSASTRSTRPWVKLFGSFWGFAVGRGVGKSLSYRAIPEPHSLFWVFSLFLEAVSNKWITRAPRTDGHVELFQPISAIFVPFQAQRWENPKHFPSRSVPFTPKPPNSPKRNDSRPPFVT